MYVNLARSLLQGIFAAAAKLAGDADLDGYHLFPSVRVDLLMMMGRFPEAREEIERAVDMTQNLREQELLTERLKIKKAAPSSAVQSCKTL